MAIRVHFKNGESSISDHVTEVRPEWLGEIPDVQGSGLAGLACYDRNGKKIGHFVLDEIVGYILY
jgi:hypothetical protein